ncbi:MAG: hypothetical protein NC099_06280 [Corallococcus sp.]|nr:hypothetical protein [Bacillota bacterium]MCM1534240.1 hypothetical protein [Corallococcus sp.]
MKYCQHCGAEIANDDAVICIKCGCNVATDKSTQSDETLLKVARIFMIISCCLNGAYMLFALIMFIPLAAVQTLFLMAIINIAVGCLPLAWMIPLTVKVSNKIKNRLPISIALKVCTLIFVSLVAGILLLCSNDD